MRYLASLLAIFFLCGSGTIPESRELHPEIHCKHWIYGYPKGTPASNDLIIRDCYAMSSNDETKFADWVAYRLDETTVTGDAQQTTRKWKADPWLDDSETLEPKDYKSAHAELKTDRGHQAPLAAFKGTDCWAETNFLSNITPQKSELNQGLWVKLEGKLRKLAETETVYVLTGPLYEKEMLALPEADEPHKIPSGYWKIIAINDEQPNTINCAGFIFTQDTPRTGNLINFVVNIDEIETRSKLDFFSDLPGDVENIIESSVNTVLANVLINL